MNPFTREQRQSVGVARVKTNRRMGFLQRSYPQRDVLILMKLACETERTVGRKRFLDEHQRFMGECPAILKVGAVGSEKIRDDARNQAEFEPAVGNIVKHRGVLSDAQG